MVDAICFDTDVLIDMGRGEASAVASYSVAALHGRPAVSSIVYMELLVGCRNRREQRQVDKFITELVLLPVDPVVCSRAIELLSVYRMSHGLLIPDALIAATSLVHQLPLVTKNQRHYRFIKGLLLRPYPLQ
jgi:predicted nucleic acid-binding protein